MCDFIETNPREVALCATFWVFSWRITLTGVIAESDSPVRFRRNVSGPLAEILTERAPPPSLRITCTLRWRAALRNGSHNSRPEGLDLLDQMHAFQQGDQGGFDKMYASLWKAVFLRASVVSQK